MTSVGITPQLKATMLKYLAAGHDLDFTARATGVPRDRVLDVVANHGYPDAEKMAWAADIILDDANKIPERQATLATQASGNGHRNGGVRLAEPATPRPTLQSIAASHRVASIPPVSTARPVHTSTTELLHQASESAHARTRGLGAKISSLLADLTARLADEQEAREAKARADRADAARVARIEVLEAELAKLKGKRSKPARENTRKIAHSDGAKTGNIPCSTTGCERTFTNDHAAAVHAGRSHAGGAS